MNKEITPEGFEPPSEKVEYGEPTDEFDFDDWEPSTETCKNCADRFYDGHVNTGQHNLCEGRHCQDMRESEEDELLGENRLTKVVDRWNLDKTKTYKITKGEYEQLIEDGITTIGLGYTDSWNKIKYWFEGWNLTAEEPQEGLYNLNGSLCNGEIKDINKDLQFKPSIKEHFKVPLIPQEVIPTLSKNKRKKLEVFIPNNKQESRPFQTIKLKTH